MENNDEKLIIVFGATGAIGAYATLHLLEKGYKVIAVGKRQSDNNFLRSITVSIFQWILKKYMILTNYLRIM